MPRQEININLDQFTNHWVQASPVTLTTFWDNPNVIGNYPINIEAQDVPSQQLEEIREEERAEEMPIEQNENIHELTGRRAPQGWSFYDNAIISLRDIPAAQAEESIKRHFAYLRP